MKGIPFVIVLMALVLSACAPATPTTDPAQIQASAVAAANTMVALTQAAVPTATPIPPTPLPSPTPQPSPTLLALPTLSIQLTPTTGAPAAPTSNTGGDPCQAPMPAKPAGPQATVRILNTTKASVILSLYLLKNDFGECGYRSFNLDSGGGTSTTLPIGCYFGGAFVNDPKKPTKAFGSGCIRNATGGSVTVGTEVIRISQ